MANKSKEWLLPLGERSVDTGSTDALLRSKIAERDAKKVEQQEEIDELTHEAKVAELKKKVEGTAGKSSGESKPTESPVKFEVKGGVNLGEIDFAEERRKAAEELRQMQKDQEQNLRTLGAQNEALRDKIHEKEMQVLQLSFQSQMDILNKMIESNASKGDFTQQLAAARAIAQELGYSPAPTGSGGGDLQNQIKLKEMEFNNSLAIRKLDEEAKDREFQRKLDMQRLEDDRQYKKMEAERQAKRDEFFASFPEAIGRGLARGMSEHVRSSGGAGEDEKSHAISNKKQAQPGIEAGEGEAGEADCINCGKTMAIGSSAKEAVCAGCGIRYPIKRVKTPPTEEEE